MNDHTLFFWASSARDLFGGVAAKGKVSFCLKCGEYIPFCATRRMCVFANGVVPAYRVSVVVVVFPADGATRAWRWEG